jgi:hypothetical protein
MPTFGGGTVSGDILPNDTGQDLGNPNQRWDAFLQSLDVSNDAQVTGNLNVDGSVTAGSITGNITGNVTGNVTGDVTGNLTGNVTGDVTGNVTGNLTGDVTGNVTGNLTGDVTSTGTSSFATATVKKLNNVRFADQFPGATADVKINAAIADLPVGGGTVDCRGFGATTQTIAATVTIGENSGTGKTVTLLLDRTTTYEATISNNSPAFKVCGGSSMVALGTVANPNAGLTLSASAAVSNILLVENDEALNLVGSYVEGVMMAANATATVSDAILGVKDCLQITQFSNISISGGNITNTVGLKIYATTGNITGNVQFNNIYVEMFGGAGCRPVWIGSAASGSLTPIASMGVNTVTFLGASALTHPGTGLPIVTIEASDGAGGMNTTANIGFYGTQIESMHTGDIGILINGAESVHVYGLCATANTNAGAAVIKLAQPAGTLLDGIDIRGVDNQASWTLTLNNTVTSDTYAPAVYPRLNYSYCASTHRQDVNVGGIVVMAASAPTTGAGQIGLGSQVATTVGAAGGASALPATPTGYLLVNIAGTDRKIPFYAG